MTRFQSDRDSLPQMWARPYFLDPIGQLRYATFSKAIRLGQLDCSVTTLELKSRLFCVLALRDFRASILILQDGCSKTLEYEENMLAVIVILVVILVLSLYSEVHALGLWLFMMITHNYLTGLIGSGASHMPMFAGLIIMTVIVARRKWTAIPTSIFLLLIALFAVMTAAAITGFYPARSLGQILLYSKGFLLAVLIAGTIKSKPQVECLTKYFLAAVSLAAFMTYFERFTGAYVIDAETIQRAGRFTGNPNDTAMFLLTGIPIALYWASHSKRLPISIIHLALIALFIGGVTFTQSRSGFVTLLFFLFLLYIWKPSIKASVVGVIILSTGLVFVSNDSAFWDRMGTVIGLEEERGQSLSKRKHYVQAGVQLVFENPGLGVGMGNFGRAMMAADPTYRENDPNRSAHNMYIELFAENGVIGGLLFLALLGISVLWSIQYDKRNELEYSTYGLGFCVSMSLLTILLYGFFNSHGKSSVMWFLIGLGLAFGLMTKNIVTRPTTATNNKILANH